MTKHIHVHLHDAAYQTKGGETTWGAKDPKKALDAGTSEGAKKAAETRKRGGGAQTEFTTKPAAENYTKRQTTAKGTTIKYSGNKHLPLKNEQGHALHTYHSSSGDPAGHGYHKNLSEARAEALRKHGSGAYATFGHSS